MFRPTVINVTNGPAGATESKSRGTGMFNMQAESFFSKWCQDIVDTKARATTSDFGQQAPLVGDFGFSAGWQDSVVFVPYWLYQIYGDLRPAQRFYTNMVSHLAYYGTNSSDFVGPNSGYGDWVAVDGSTPLNLISTAFYARCAGMVAEMAQALGKTSDAATYGLLFTNIRSAFQANFVAADGTVGSGSEGGYALALGFQPPHAGPTSVGDEQNGGVGLRPKRPPLDGHGDAHTCYCPP